MSEQSQTIPPGVLGPDRTGAPSETEPSHPPHLQAVLSRLEGLAADVARLEARLSQAEAESRELRAETARLDEDLDESRRLNLRAAELLDVVYTELGKQAPRSEAEERGNDA